MAHRLFDVIHGAHRHHPHLQVVGAGACARDNCSVTAAQDTTSLEAAEAKVGLRGRKTQPLRYPALHHGPSHLRQVRAELVPAPALQQLPQCPRGGLLTKHVRE